MRSGKRRTNMSVQEAGLSEKVSKLEDELAKAREDIVSKDKEAERL